MLKNLESLFYSLIHWGERRLKTDLSYLLKGGFWLTSGQVASSGASFILAIAFANLLPPETYGTYRYVLSVASILAIPALGGINTSLIQAIAAGKEGSTTNALSTKLRYGLLGSLASLIGSAYYLMNANITLATSFVVVALFLPIMESYNLYDSILQGRKDFRRSAIFNAAIQTFAALGIITTLLLTKNVVLLIGAYFFFWMCGRLFLWRYVRTRTPQLNSEKDPRTVPFGKHLSLMGVGNAVAQYADRVLLFQNIGAAEVAVYSIAIAMPEQVKALLQSVTTLLLPRYSGQSAQSIRATIWRKASLLGLAALAGALAYIVIIPFLFPIFFPKYVNAIVYSQLYALSLVAVVGSIFSTALQALHKTRALYIINIVQPIVQITTLTIGIIFFGVMGAILARVITRLVMLTFTGILYAIAGAPPSAQS